jgi:hypothetical protein
MYSKIRNSDKFLVVIKFRFVEAIEGRWAAEPGESFVCAAEMVTSILATCAVSGVLRCGISPPIHGGFASPEI